MIKFIKERFLKSDFSSKILTLLTGTTISQAIPILISPILTRIYSPEDFGILALLLSISGILSVIASGRYELAIMLPKSDVEATAIAVASIAITAIFTLLVAVFINVFSLQIASLAGNNLVEEWLFLVPVMILLTSLYQILNFWNNRKSHYKNMSIAISSQSALAASSNLVMGFSGMKPGGLILSMVIGKLGSISVLFYKAVKELHLKDVNRGLIKLMIKQYSDFPLKSSWGIFFNLLSNQTPLILIGSLYSSTILGYYAVVLKVLNTPLMMIGKAFSQVFYQESQGKDSKQLENLFNKSAKKLFVIAIIPMLGLFVYSNDIFEIVFGAKWKEAGELARLFVLFYFVRFVFSPLSTLFLTKRKLTMEVVFNICFFASQVSSVFAGYYFFNSYYYSFLFMGITGAIMFIIEGKLLHTISKE